MNNIAIIPARSGSKGLIDKNIKLLNGKPLLYYTIEAAIKSNLFSCVHVSTDSQLYAEIAEQYGADVPFLRNESLASDEADTWDVVRFVIKAYEEIGRAFDTIAILQPTSPLRDKTDIIEAYNFYIENNANSVISVCEMEHSPLWSNVLSMNRSMENFIMPENNKRRQDLPVYYRENGAIYIQDKELVLNYGNVYGKNSYAYIMSKEKSIDIDCSLDFKIAEIIMNLN